MLEQRIIDPSEAKRKFQDSPTVATSKDTIQGGGLNLAVRRAKPNLAGPFSRTPKTKGGTSSKDPQPVILQNKNAATAAEAQEPLAETQAGSSNPGGVQKSTSTPHSSTRNKKDISRNTSPETILDTFNSKDLSAADWNRLKTKCSKEEYNVRRQIYCNLKKMWKLRKNPITLRGFRTNQKSKKHRFVKAEGPKRDRLDTGVRLNIR